MKKLFILIYASLAFASCGPKQEQPKQEEQAPAASDLMKEAPLYDATKIDPNAPVTTITLIARGNTMTDMSYDQPELRVKEGTTIKLTLINESTDASMSHNFMLIEEGTADKVGPEAVKAGVDKDFIPSMKQMMVATKMTKPKEKSEIMFPAPAKGSYDFICSYPGHYTRMKGKFIVE